MAPSHNDLIYNGRGKEQEQKGERETVRGAEGVEAETREKEEEIRTRHVQREIPKATKQLLLLMASYASI